MFSVAVTLEFVVNIVFCRLASISSCGFTLSIEVHAKPHSTGYKRVLIHVL